MGPVACAYVPVAPVGAYAVPNADPAAIGPEARGAAPGCVACAVALACVAYPCAAVLPCVGASGAAFSGAAPGLASVVPTFERNAATIPALAVGDGGAGAFDASGAVDLDASVGVARGGGVAAATAPSVGALTAVGVDPVAAVGPLVLGVSTGLTASEFAETLPVSPSTGPSTAEPTEPVSAAIAETLSYDGSHSNASVSLRAASNSSMTSRIDCGRRAAFFESIRITSAPRCGGICLVGASSGTGSSIALVASKCG